MSDVVDKLNVERCTTSRGVNKLIVHIDIDFENTGDTDIILKAIPNVPPTLLPLLLWKTVGNVKSDTAKVRRYNSKHGFHLQCQGINYFKYSQV